MLHFMRKIGPASPLMVVDTTFFQMLSPAILVCIVANSQTYANLEKTCGLSALKCKHFISDLYSSAPRYWLGQDNTMVLEEWG